MEPIYFRRSPVHSLRISAGFTLIELLVVLAIIMVVLGIVLTSQSSFNGTLVLQNTAYDIALTLRNAQTYGLGSRVTSVTANSGYGIHFEASMPQTITLFADTFPSPNGGNCHGLPPGGSTAPDAQRGNCVYDPNQDQKVADYTLGNGIIIQDVCALHNTVWKCEYTHSSTLNSLDIVFARPNPDVFMQINGNSGLSYTSACITVASPGGATRTVSVNPSGAIFVSTIPCQ